eukprot:14318-Heterococcus_DN1.PRE.2
MKDSGIAPDAHGYCCVINSRLEGGQWQQAVQLLSDAQQAGVANASCYNTAMAVCNSAKQWQHTLQLFSDLQQQQQRAAVQVPAASYHYGIIAYCGLGS